MWHLEMDWEDSKLEGSGFRVEHLQSPQSHFRQPQWERCLIAYFSSACETSEYRAVELPCAKVDAATIVLTS